MTAILNLKTAESVIRLADLAVERGCYLPLLPKQRLAAEKARREMEGYQAFCDATVQETMSEMKIEIAILRNPWNWGEKTLEWARREAELTGQNHCPRGYDECLSGCCYPGRCIQSDA